MNAPCSCPVTTHRCRSVVLTGGPGGGKTAVLEIVRNNFCEHIAVLPEAASIVFSGGFPRKRTEAGQKAAQRAIYHIQRELERLVHDEGHAALALCDRGTVDGLAYWPGPPEAYWTELGTSLDAELSRYAAVIHLRTPPPDQGYNHVNPMRVESAREAAVLDARIAQAWSAHPRRFFVENTGDFLDKAAKAVALIRDLVPPCCHGHLVPDLEGRG